MLASLNARSAIRKEFSDTAVLSIHLDDIECVGGEDALDDTGSIVPNVNFGRVCALRINTWKRTHHYVGCRVKSQRKPKPAPTVPLRMKLGSVTRIGDTIAGSLSETRENAAK